MQKGRKLMKNRVAVFLAAAVLLNAVAVRAAEEKKKSLYERLGGVYAIAEARARVPKAGLKFHVTALVCQVTGGPQMYTGRTMKDAHTKLHITQREGDAMAADFVAVLDQYKVPKAEQNELLTIVGSTKGDIVVEQKAEK